MRLIEIRNSAFNALTIALSWRAQERLSHEPLYQLELQSPNPDLDIEALMGEAIGVDIDLGNGGRRAFHAHVIAASDTGQNADQYTYQIQLGSWLSFLSENQNSRIFQNLTVPQIVEQVFQGHRRNDYRFLLDQSYEPREYCVQFRESDLAFVKRLLEEEGIYFWIEHQEERHTVVLSDSQRFDDLLAPYASMYFLPDGEEQRAIADREGVQRLQRTRRIRPNNVVLRDFDYNVPTNRLDADAQIAQSALAGIQLEHYQYAAGYATAERGDRLARLRLEAYQAESHLLQGLSNARGLATGKAFTLVGHPDLARNCRYVVTDSDLTYLQDGPDSAAAGRNVVARFMALNEQQPFRPLLVTPKPAVPGIQSATVVGPAGSEVHTDKLGRVRVHFHWDRYTTNQEDASCWIRVSQAWAGKGWGVIAMPRVGQEVLITYVDGDLDRPLVTGVVYNGDNPTPYDLPKDIRYTGLVSRSLRQGGVEHASQITFDDQRGAERVMIHAQNDLQHTIERNASTSVGQDLNIQVASTTTTTTDNQITYQNTSVSHTGTQVAYTGLSTQFIGESVASTGKSTTYITESAAYTDKSSTYTGESIAYTGKSSAYTGDATSYYGINTTYSGDTISYTGRNTTYTGVVNGIAGSQNFITGVRTAIVGSETALTGESFYITGVAITETLKSININELITEKVGLKVIS